jgi:glycosyltransferase involved in cell wall biosynthesis
MQAIHLSLSKTRVAHVITRLELGGAQQITLYCCEHLDRKKFEVYLVAGKGGYLDLETRMLAPETQVQLVSWLKHPVRPFYDLYALLRLRSFFKREKIHVVHTHSSKAGILGRLAAAWAGVPVVIHTVHGWGFHEGQAPWVKAIYVGLERFCAKFTKTLIAVSEENKRYGLANGIGEERQYRVIHSGIDPSQYKVSKDRGFLVRRKMGLEEQPTVLVLSNFKKQKSPMTVVEVLEKLVAKVPDVVLLWAGDGPGRRVVEEALTAKGLLPNARLLGWRTDVADLLAASDVLLLTSIYEGLPRVVLQAMAAEKPVVATAVSGTPEAVENDVNGFLREPGNAEGMAVDLACLLMDPELAKKMGKAGRKRIVGTFKSDEMLKEIEKIYESGMTIEPGEGYLFEALQRKHDENLLS